MKNSSQQIIKELQIQIALGTVNTKEAEKILKFMAHNSCDERELIELFWILVDHGYDGAWLSAMNLFNQNNAAPHILKKYILPLASNRPIPKWVEKAYPRKSSNE